MILAIDLGSTSFKAAIFDRRLRQISVGNRRLSYRFGVGGRVELETASVHAALRGALSAAGVGNREIRIIALTSQAQTFTLVDAHGRSQSPFVSWQDSRATSACAELKRRLPDFGEHCSFGELLPNLQVCQLLRMHPGAGTMPLNLPSYVLRLWSGVSKTDDNIAAMGGLYSLSLNEWWPAAIRACGLRGAQLPGVIPVGEIAAETTSAARRFGLPAGVPVVLAGNDQTAGGYASYLERISSPLITLGTAQVAYACRRRMPRPRLGTIRGPYPGGLFYRMAADSCGGNIVNWAKTVLVGCGNDERFFRQARHAPPGCHGLVFDASLDTGSWGWRNLGLNHTTADMARSIIQNLGVRMADMVHGLGVTVKDRKALVAGGGNAQPLWRQILAKALDMRLIVTDATPLEGAARMAARHLRRQRTPIPKI